MFQLNKENTLAIIPARGGSKRLKKKNLYPVLGKPMIEYSLDTLKQLSSVATPFISSEDPEILNFCRDQGFDISYRRPLHLAQDDTSIIDVILHAVDWYKDRHGIIFKAVILLQPTSPDRMVQDVKKGILKFNQDTNKSLVSIQPMLEPPEECVCIEDNGEWSGLLGKVPDNHNSNNFSKKYYFIDGSIYISSVNHLKKYRSFVVSEKTNFLMLDKRWPVDIDFIEDLEVAEFLMKNKFVVTE